MYQRIPVLLAALVLPLLLSAQVTDTLNWARYHEGTETLYISPNGGYTFGNNGYGDHAKAQTFAISDSSMLRGALMRFGVVVNGSGNAESKIRVNVHANNGAGRTTNGLVVNAPDTVVAYRDVPVSELPTDGSLFEVNLEVDLSDSLLASIGMFSIGIDLTLLAPGDTVALMSTTHGDAGRREAVWELGASGEWITVLTNFSWELDVDIAIFPLVDINEPLSVPDRQMDAGIFPNPTDGPLTLMLGQGADWQVEVMGMDGRTSRSLSFSGERETLDLSGLPSGMYVLRVTDGIRTFTQRVIRL